MSEHLSVGEFQRAMQALERTVTTGFERTDARLERIESGQAGHGERLAVVEASVKSRRRHAVGWGTAVATGMATLFEGIRTYLSPR
jgi:hypothetical protein